MRRRSRTRRVLKWVGTVAWLFLLGLWLASWGSRAWWTKYRFREMAVSLGLDTGYYCLDLQRVPSGAPSLPIYGHPAMGLYRNPSVWMYVRPFKWRHEQGVLYHKAMVIGEAWSLFVNAWVPAILLAAPTAYLWWLDRRRYPPGHCQRCGYNLTANVSGVCPECGTPLKREGETE